MRKSKTTKRKTKASSTSNKQSSVQLMEREWRQIPIKMASQLNKEISAHKQIESKLKLAIDKITKQLKVAKAKNQLIKAKKSHLQLSKQLQETTKIRTALSNKQSKMLALRKQLSHFEKDWQKNANKTLVKAKPKKRTARPKTVTPALIQARVESAQTIIDNVGLGESTELVS